MDGITDISFRRMVETYSPEIDFTVTEFINVQGFFSNPEKHFPKLLFYRDSRPCILQVFGNIDQLVYFRKISTIAQLCGFSGIDLNVGCPDNSVVRSRSGAGLIGHRKEITSIINSLKFGLSRDGHKAKIDSTIHRLIDNYKQRGFFKENSCKPFLSLKTRIGIDRTMNNTWWNFLDKLNLDFITIHGRTLKQKFAGSANWTTIHNISKTMKTPVLGNGDIKADINTSRDSDSLKKLLTQKLKYTPAGIMIGRGFLGHPNLLLNSKYYNYKLQTSMLKHHFDEYTKFYSKYIDPFKKFINYYLAGFANIKDTRINIMKCQTATEMSKEISKL